MTQELPGIAGSARTLLSRPKPAATGGATGGRDDTVSNTCKSLLGSARVLAPAASSHTSREFSRRQCAFLGRRRSPHRQGASYTLRLPLSMLLLRSELRCCLFSAPASLCESLRLVHCPHLRRLGHEGRGWVAGFPPIRELSICHIAIRALLACCLLLRRIRAYA